MPSGNGKSTNNSTKTYDRFALGANEPNISDTTGACDPEESKVTKILCDSDYQPAENTTPSTAAKQIVSVDQKTYFNLPTIARQLGIITVILFAKSFSKRK